MSSIRCAVDRCDCRLNVILADFRALGVKIEKRHPLSDELLIRSGAILVEQRSEVPGRIDSRGQTRGVQTHQGGEGIDPRGGREGKLNKDGGQARGFVAKLATNCEFGICSVVVLIKQQVEGGMDCRKPWCELGRRRYVEQPL